jgi:Chalcone isomerase-like
VGASRRRVKGRAKASYRRAGRMGPTGGHQSCCARRQGQAPRPSGPVHRLWREVVVIMLRRSVSAAIRNICTGQQGALAHSHALPRHSPAQTSAPVDIAGIKYPISATVGPGSLQLNGAGIRYKFVVKVYTAMGTLNMSEIFAAKKRLMAGGQLLHRLRARRRHHGVNQRQSGRRADQVTRVLHRADENLARQQPGRLPAQGCAAAAGQGLNARDLSAPARRASRRSPPCNPACRKSRCRRRKCRRRQRRCGGCCRP